MDSILIPFAFGWIMFIVAGNFFRMLTATIIGIISFFITYAYSLFDLPDYYIITVILSFTVLYILALIVKKLNK